MRTAVATAILFTTLSQLPPRATAATSGDLPTVASHARRCERIARRLAAGERRARSIARSRRAAATPPLSPAERTTWASTTRCRIRTSGPATSSRLPTGRRNPVNAPVACRSSALGRPF